MEMMERLLIRAGGFAKPKKSRGHHSMFQSRMATIILAPASAANQSCRMDIEHIEEIIAL
jgi:hypothetical protein